MSENKIMNGDFWQKLSFGKFVATLVVGLAVQFYAFQIHILDETRHVSFKEKAILSSIQDNGYTYSLDEKLVLAKEYIILQKRIEAIEKQLTLYRTEGRLQTPAEKIDLFKRAVREVLKEK